jgi:hypothetical protein
MKVSAYSEEYAELWDEFVARAPMATFLHSRCFLSYHGDRFQDVSLIIEGEENSLLGLFPAAVDPTHSKRVISHPGITYGGLIHGRDLRGEKVLQALQAVIHHYAASDFESLRYKAVPYIYHRVPCSDDLYALFRLGATRYRCDLSCAIDLASRRNPAQRRERGLKKALKSGIEIEKGPRFAGQLWQVVEGNLAKKYGAKPVHSLDEILNLHSSFPKSVEFVVGLLHSEVVAGVVLFSTSQVAHAQYTASSPKGYESCALDAVFDYCVGEAQARGLRYFDFGISNEEDGKYLNAQLYQFKSEFGGGGVVHEFYEFRLRS